MNRHSITAALTAFAILPLMLAPLSALEPLYYAVLLVLPIVQLWHARSVSLLLLVTFAAAVIGILLNNPMPVFRPRERLGMFVLLLAAIGPLFRGSYHAIFVRRLFRWLARFCLIIGALSACCAVFGINCSGSVFSGLTPHSMVLGPVAGIGFLYAIRRVFIRYTEKGSIPLQHLISGVACLAAVFLSASRSALLATVAGALYLLLRIPRGRWMMFLLMGILCLLLLPFAGDLTDGLLSKMVASREAGSIFSSRAELWSDRWEEFTTHPLFGVGFASQSIITFAHSLQSGIIEPGSSYLGSLSMLGLTGALPLFLLISTALRQGLMQTGIPTTADSTLVFFCIHMAFEGYLLSAGSILCILLWSCISAALTSKEE